MISTVSKYGAANSEKRTMSTALMAKFGTMTAFASDAKIDAPSGTALDTARRIAAVSDEWAPDPTTKLELEGARGGSGAAGIPIHSVRMRGLVAHQEVLLGTTGQTLTIRQDSYDRTSYMPGVVLAVKGVGAKRGLTLGLDTLLGL